MFVITENIMKRPVSHSVRSCHKYCHKCYDGT